MLDIIEIILSSYEFWLILFHAEFANIKETLKLQRKNK
jgi:hypothetical protein